MCDSPPQGSQVSEALVYRGVSSSRSRLATKLGIRDGCTSLSMPSSLRAIRSFLHVDRREWAVNPGHAIIHHNIVIIKNTFPYTLSLTHLFISQSLALVVRPSNLFLNSETKRRIKTTKYYSPDRWKHLSGKFCLNLTAFFLLTIQWWTVVAKGYQIEWNIWERYDTS